MTARRIFIVAVTIVLALQIAIAAWWLPQRWQACQKLYDNRRAQIACLLFR